MKNGWFRFLGFLASLSVFVLVFAAVSEAAVGVSISPSRFRLKKPAGQAASGKVSIQNSGTYPVTVSIETADIISRQNEDGISVRDEAPPGTTPHSCAAWIQVPGQGDFVVPPGESKDLEFVVSPPPGITSGGYGAYLFLLTKPVLPAQVEKGNAPEVQLVTVPRLGVSVVYEVEGTVQRTGDLVNLELVPPTKTQPLKIRHGFVNKGNAEVIFTGTFHIMDSQGALVGKGSLRALKTFPNERAVTETTWSQSLPAGRYTALITFELGPEGREAIVRELTFDVPSS